VHEWAPIFGIFITKAKAIAPLIIPPQPINANSLALIVLLLKKSLKK
jgi:hypothetical protein